MRGRTFVLIYQEHTPLYQHTVHIPLLGVPCGCTAALVPFGGGLVGMWVSVLTSILPPLYLLGEFSRVYLPAYSCPCTSWGSSLGCTYQHTPAFVPLGGVLVGVLTSILLPLYLSGSSRGCSYQHTPALVPLGEFSWMYLPAYSCPCTSRGSSRGCVV